MVDAQNRRMTSDQPAGTALCTADLRTVGCSRVSVRWEVSPTAAVKQRVKSAQRPGRSSESPVIGDVAAKNSTHAS
jgi:hypothetical protein